MFAQIPSSGSNYTLGSSSGSMFASSGYLYQIVVRNGIDCFIKLDITSGAISFSKTISVGATTYSLKSITLDSSNNIYILASNISDKILIGKFSNIDGSCIWAQTITPAGAATGYTSFPLEIHYSNGYLYFGFYYVTSGTNRYSNYSRISTNGVVDGTYDLCTFTTVTPTVSNNNSNFTGTDLAIPLTTTFTTNNYSYTKTTDTLTVNTVAIP
jgi:hypothetical protein